MLAAERRSKLAHLVRSSKIMSTEGLASALAVSAETIRRDLLLLEKEGVLERVHGGATVRGQSVVASEPSFEVRSEGELSRKQRIAAVAADLVPAGSMVMIDVGTTAMLAARALPHTLSATVVTTSLRVAVELSDRPGIDVIVAGGRMRSGDLALSGMATEALLADIHFDIALLGSGGLHPEAGLTDFYLEEARTRRTIIANTTSPYVLCDATKFGKVARYRVAAFEDLAGVIVDEKPGSELDAALRAAGTDMIVATT
ncbi:DeoR/GlpR family DNA-binding transcription regulator [Mycolicibacterium litorale]|uniref:DeoR/GlpR family DNA-binding transcription regulator n=1 Tax=Mycolicibacterium litorale TaxID=758802 RepID=UPI003CF9037E